MDVALNDAGISNTAIIGKNGDDMLTVRYNDFLPITVKAVQEQQILIEELRKANAVLIKANIAILARLEALENNTLE